MEDDLDITVTWKRLLPLSHHLTVGIQMTFYLELFKQRLVLTLVYSLEQLCCFCNLEHSPLVVSLKETHAGSAHFSLHRGLD